MFIGIDYDHTYTKDPDLWEKFIHLIKMHGHECAIVTLRHKNEPIDDVNHTIYYTGRKSKDDFMKQIDIHVDVWCDDMPWFINNDCVV